MITKADHPRFNYDYELELWYLITPVTLAYPQVVQAVDYCKRVYEKRIRGEGDPAKRKRMAEAVSHLDPKTVQQFMIGSGEKTLYHADKL